MQKTSFKYKYIKKKSNENKLSVDAFKNDQIFM